MGSSELETLVARVTHEVNNPLTYVLLHLNALVRDLPRVLAEARDRGEDETATRLEQALRRAVEAKDGVVRIQNLVQSLRGAVGGETAAGPAGARPVGVSGRRMRLLIVEDEPELGDALRSALRDEHDVALVRSNAAAVAAATAAAGFDAILCDLVVTDGTAIELYEELARRVPGLERRMIFMSGGAYTDALTEFLGKVPNARVVKPFSIEQLRGLLGV